MYALDYSPRQRRAPEHQAHAGGDPNWKDSAVQSSYVPGRIRGGTDADDRRWRSCSHLVQEPFLQSEPVRCRLCLDPRGRPIWGPERRQHDVPIPCAVQAGCVCRHSQLCRRYPAPPHGGKGHGRRKPIPACYQAAKSRCHQVFASWVWITSGAHAWLQSTGVERFLQPVDWPGMGRLAPPKPRPPIQGSTLVGLSLRHRGGEPLAWWISFSSEAG